MEEPPLSTLDIHVDHEELPPPPSVAACAPVADVVAFALTTQLRKQLGKNNEDGIDARDVAAFAEALRRCDALAYPDRAGIVPVGPDFAMCFKRRAPACQRGKNEQERRS